MEFARGHGRLKSSLVLLLAELAVLGTLSDTRAATKASVAEGEVRVARAENSELYEREVDEVALSSQESAIAKLLVLLKKYHGMSQEPVLLSRLADLYQQNAAIRFRIAHGLAHRSKRNLDLGAYKKAMTNSIQVLTQLIDRFPAHESLSHGLYLRGKAYEEVGTKGLASTDYTRLITEFPDAEEVVPALMALAQFSIDANQHPQAIAYFLKVEKHPEEPLYPFGLYKLAWSYYNLKDVPAALTYIRKHVEYYDTRLVGLEGEGAEGQSSEAALRESSLLDSAVFFFEGFEQGKPAYATTEALPYFRSLTKSASPHLGKILNRYAKLLRSHGHEDAMVQWKDQVLAQESARPESLDVLITVYEALLNKHRYAQCVALAADMTKLYKDHPKFEGFPRAQKLLLDTAEMLQTLVVKNQGALEIPQMTQNLASIYDSFLHIVTDDDPRIAQAYYNLAETEFAIADFAKSTEHYRWIVENRKRSAQVVAQVADAELKAVSSRYQVLKLKNGIPTDIKLPSNLGAKLPDADSKLDPQLKEWLTWVDQLFDRLPQQEEVQNFYFEANRSLYSNGRILTATERMRRFASKYPSSRYAVPSATLVLDTLVAAADWEHLYDLTMDFAAIQNWAAPTFAAKCAALAADSHYKLSEGFFRQKDYASVLKRTKRFLKVHGQSQRLAETLLLAGQSALALQDRDAAQAYFTRLIREVPGSASIAGALLARARMAEENYKFTDAAHDYRAYLSLPVASRADAPAATLNDLRRKALRLGWLAGVAPELLALRADPSICTADVAPDCDRAEALALWLDGATPRAERSSAMVGSWVERARNGIEANRPLWGAAALLEAERLGFRDRLAMVRAVGQYWSQLAPIDAFVLLPSVQQTIVRALELDRLGMNQNAPLKAESKYITRRIEAMHEVENAATAAAHLPWASVRARTLDQVALLYIDLSHGLKDLPEPKDLSTSDREAYQDTIAKLMIPFEEKGQEIRRAAFELASRAQIESTALDAIAGAFFADNPSQAAKLKASRVPVEPKAPVFGLALLPTLDPLAHWRIEKHAAKNAVATLWLEAALARRWPQIAFYLSEAQSQADLKGLSAGLMKAFSLELAGAHSEAWTEFQDSTKNLTDPESQQLAYRLLRTGANLAYQPKEVDRWQKELDRLDPEKRKLAEANAAAAAKSANAGPSTPLDPAATTRKPSSR